MRLLELACPFHCIKMFVGKFPPKPLPLCGKLEIPDVNVAFLCDSGERFDFSLCQRKPLALNPGGLKSLVKKPLDVEAVADGKN
jgi:hypothetical protein